MGSVTVQGETFSSENVVEKLEYEVEVAFAQKGLERRDRKQILGELVRSVVKKMATDVFSHWREYFTLGQKLLNEKHVIVYSIYPDEQKVLEEKKWTGTVSKHIDGDYMLWVDANLGALKTDAVMKRALTYTLRPSGTTYIGTATMRYAHTGGRDWKTSRYLTYVRIYLPYGTRLISASGMEKNARGVRTTTLDTGTEFGRTWYGGFASIEPGSVDEVSFRYEVAPQVARMLASGTYYSVFQKQLGTRDHILTLDLDFGRRVIGATPGENSRNYGDNRFTYAHNLQLDQYFSIKLE
jgi:hypothetical protein